MNKISYFGYVYFVSIADNNYVVKVNHLNEFVSLMHDNGIIAIIDFEKTKVFFDNVHQWYKKV